ncbi:MAG: ABC transporter permease [Thermodesulfovibrio sp.]|nr:ABC transporter permease [Thermodesulfovibrio sp.]
MRALDHKLWRDLWKMKGQMLAICLVIASGVCTYVMLISTMQSLNQTRDRFYEDYGFAEVFASLKRAPENIRLRVSEIPGVNQVETRVVAQVKLDIKGFPEPVTAKLVSVPDFSSPLLNKLYIRRGRPVDPDKDNEVVVSEAFAEAHKFSPGDSFGAVINGRWKTLIITGIALSPEFVLQSRPGALSPDYKRYAILWMARTPLSTAYNMKGAFNDLSLTMAPGSQIQDVIRQLDALLEQYGGLGSYSRQDQMSNRFLTEEFKQLQRSAGIFPMIFIAVAGFLLNVVISRTVSTQRDQIAALKAFGYDNFSIGIHYMKMVIVIVLAGIAAGTGAGIWLGRGLGKIYMEFYRFPFLMHELRPSVVIGASLISIVSALAGTFYAVRKAALLPPAEAMRPEPPAQYRKTILEHLGLGRALSQPTRIILRNIERRPIKTLLSVLGIALASAVMVAGMFSKDAIDFMVDVQFRLHHREDMTATFVEPTSRKALFELKRFSGIEYAEPFRSVPAQLRFGHRSFRTSIEGTESVADGGGRLYRLLDMKLQPVDMPASGILLTDYLGKMLGIKEGDMLTVEVLEGSRPFLQIRVAGLVKQYIGLMGFMELSALNRLMREGNAISGAYLSIDPLFQAQIYRKLVEAPRVAGAVVRKDEIRNFYETQAEALLFFTFIASILGGIIAFGVVYNTARISLAERSRELASLRVLGYTRGEISYIFLGELAFLTLVSILPGFLIGRGICSYIARALESDLFRIPVVIQTDTYTLAATVVLLAACFSGLIVRHRLDHLDLVEVLKTKE